MVLNFDVQKYLSLNQSDLNATINSCRDEVHRLASESNGPKQVLNSSIKFLLHKFYQFGVENALDAVCSFLRDNGIDLNIINSSDH